MKYIVTKRFKQKAICGDVNLPYGTDLILKDDFICLPDGRLLCARTSENAHNYFSRDDDGQGKYRAKLVYSIKKKLSAHKDNHQELWDRMWEDEVAQKLRRKDHEDYFLWGDDFYNASISDLEHIKKILEK